MEDTMRHVMEAAGGINTVVLVVHNTGGPAAGF